MASASLVTPNESAIDRRVWWILGIVGFFAVLVMKEVSLPSWIIAAFGCVGLVMLLAIGMRSPEIPLYILIAYLPFSRVLVGDFGTEATAFNLTNLFIVWVLIGHLLHSMSKRQALFVRAPLNKWVWLFCLMGAASLVRSGWDYGSWYAEAFILPLKRWLTPMFLYFLTLWVVRDKRPMKAIVVVIMVAVTVVGAMASWDYLSTSSSHNLEHARIGGIAQNPNTLGAFFNYYMFLLLSFWLVYAKKPKAWLLLIPFLICFRGIMVTFSRGAYLAFAAGSLTACFFKKKPLFLVAAAVLWFAVTNPSLLPHGIQNRMGMTIKQRGDPSFYVEPIEDTLESSAAGRLVIWRGAVQIIEDHPWWGVGYGAFPQFITYYTSGAADYRDAHNSYLLIAAEMGIPTLVVFLLILLLVAYYTVWLYRHTSDRFMKAMALGYLAGIGGLLVANLFGSRMDAQEVSSYFWVLAALVMRAVLIERQALRDAKNVTKKRNVFRARRHALLPRAAL